MTLIDCDNLLVMLGRFYCGMTGPKIGVKYEGSVWMSFDHDSYIIGINNDCNSPNNFIGKFVLRLFPESYPHKSPTLNQLFTIGSAFRKYRKWEETKEV